VVLFLFGAYRSLGGGAQPKASDSAVLLRSLHEQVRASLAALVAELDTPGGRGRESEAAGDGRKVGAAVQQTLDRLPPPAALDSRDAVARTLLAAAAEDISWGWRMIQAPPLSPAVAAAATVLADHAAECCDQAAPLLVAAAISEPGDSP
jgi:hypothetical protein